MFTLLCKREEEIHIEKYTEHNTIEQNETVEKENEGTGGEVHSKQGFGFAGVQSFTLPLYVRCILLT